MFVKHVCQTCLWCRFGVVFCFFCYVLLLVVVLFFVLVVVCGLCLCCAFGCFLVRFFVCFLSCVFLVFVVCLMMWPWLLGDDGFGSVRLPDLSKVNSEIRLRCSTCRALQASPESSNRSLTPLLRCQFLNSPFTMCMASGASRSASLSRGGLEDGVTSTTRCEFQGPQ